jgi:NTE family protein
VTGESGGTFGDLEALGDRIWVVLGGGGLKGLAHGGAWRAVEESGLEVAGVVGCSVGALVGALIAGGLGWEELEGLARTVERSDIAQINRRAAWINGIRQPALFHGDPLREYIARVLPVSDWSELRFPLQINAVNLRTGLTEWFGPGANTDVSMADAIYASTALPVFYPPAVVGGNVYVDGGTESSLPLERAAECGATGILAVDVGSGRTCEPEVVMGAGMLAIHERIFSLMAWRRRSETIDRWEGPPLVLVSPRLQGYSNFSFDGVDYLLEEGYRATREALARGVPTE